MEAHNIPPEEGHEPLTDAEIETLFDEGAPSVVKGLSEEIRGTRSQLRIVDTSGKERFDDRHLSEGPSQAVKELVYVEGLEARRSPAFTKLLGSVFSEERSIVGEKGVKSQIIRILEPKTDADEYQVQIMNSSALRTRGAAILANTISVSKALLAYPALYQEFFKDFQPGSPIIIRDASGNTKEGTFGVSKGEKVEVLVDGVHETLSLSEFLKRQPVVNKDRLSQSEAIWKTK